MKLQKLNEYLVEARSNKKQRTNTDRYQIIQSGKTYPAFTVDAWYDKEKGEIIVCFIVFVSPVGVRREIKFRTNGAGVHFYDEMCETVGTNGNPCDLIGKAVYLHFEKNGEFQNVRVDMLISKEELQEALEEMEEGDVMPRKKSGSGKVSKVKKQKSNKKQNPRRETDDFDELEELEEDLDEDAKMEYDSDADDDFDDFD